MNVVSSFALAPGMKEAKMVYPNQPYPLQRYLCYAGALKTLGANKDLALPIKLFELSDVVFLAPDKEVGSTNQRQLVAVHCSKESGFEVIHGLLNRVMEVLGIPLRQGEVTCAAT